MTKCLSCCKTVYAMEALNVDGKSFHQACFKCSHCSNRLRAGNYAALQGNIYCKPHFKQLFKLKGNYSEGFGESKPTAKWQDSQAKVEAADPPSSEDPVVEESNVEIDVVNNLNNVSIETKEETIETQSTPVEEEEKGKEAPRPRRRKKKKPLAEISLAGLTTEDFERAQAKFNEADTDHNGVIDRREFFVLIDEISPPTMSIVLRRRVADQKFNFYDKDSNGFLDEVEFLVVYSDLMLELEKGDSSSANTTDGPDAGDT